MSVLIYKLLQILLLLKKLKLKLLVDLIELPLCLPLWMVRLMNKMMTINALLHYLLMEKKMIKVREKMVKPTISVWLLGLLLKLKDKSKLNFNTSLIYCFLNYVQRLKIKLDQLISVTFFLMELFTKKWKLKIQFCLKLNQLSSNQMPKLKLQLLKPDKFFQHML